MVRKLGFVIRNILILSGMVYLFLGLGQNVSAATPFGETITNSAVLQYNNSLLSETFTIQDTYTVNVWVDYAVDLIPSDTSLSVYLAETITYLHILKNTGNIVDTYILTGVSENHWDTDVYIDANYNGVLDAGDYVSDTSGTVAMGGTISVIFVIYVPDTATIYYKQSIIDYDTLTVRSMGDNNVIVFAADEGTVYQLMLDHFLLSNPSNATAGETFTLTITASNVLDKPLPFYDDTSLILSDGSITPSQADTPFTLTGYDTVFAILTVSGTHIITVSDGISGNGTSTIFINPAPTDAFMVTSSDSAITAGASFTLDVTAVDVYKNPTPVYTNTATINASSGTVTPTQTQNFVSGTTVISVSLTKSGNIILSLMDGSKSGTISINVIGDTLSRFDISAPSSITVGETFLLYITALDRFLNIASYTNVASLSIQSGTITPIVTNVFQDGLDTETVTLTRPGNLVLTIQDGINYGTMVLQVNTGALDHFNITSTNPVITAGLGFMINITAFDLFDNLVNTYGDTASIMAASASGFETVTPDFTTNFNNGIQTEVITLTKSGTVTLTVIDNVSPDSGVAGSIALFVSPADLDYFEIGVSKQIPDEGESFTLTITAYDRFNNIKTNFTNLLTYTLSETNTIIPDTSSAFTEGIMTQTVSITYPGINVVLTALDSGSGIFDTYLFALVNGGRGVSLSAGIDTIGYQGETTIIPFTITNTGTSNDTFDLVVTKLISFYAVFIEDANQNGLLDTGEDTYITQTSLINALDTYIVLLAVNEYDTVSFLSYDTVIVTVSVGIDSAISASNTNTIRIVSQSLGKVSQLMVTPGEPYIGPTGDVPLNGNIFDIIVQSADADKNGKPVYPYAEPVSFYAQNTSDTILYDSIAYFGLADLHYRQSPDVNERILINGYFGDDSYPIIVVERQHYTFVLPSPDYAQVLAPLNALPPDEFIGIQDVVDSDLERLNSAHALLLDNYAMTRIPYSSEYVPAHQFTSTLSDDKFNEPVTVIIPYLDKDQDGIVDNTAILETTLRMYMLQDESHDWEIVPGSKVHTYDNYVEADVSHFTMFTLMGSPTNNNLPKTVSYPNPFMLSDPNFNNGNMTITINTFTTVTRISVKIYNVAGTLVRTLNTGSEISSMNPGAAVWDGRNDAGRFVASGVYIYVIDTDVGQAVGKITVIK